MDKMLYCAREGNSVPVAPRRRLFTRTKLLPEEIQALPPLPERLADIARSCIRRDSCGSLAESKSRMSVKDERGNYHMARCKPSPVKSKLPIPIDDSDEDKSEKGQIVASEKKTVDCRRKKGEKLPIQEAASDPSVRKEVEKLPIQEATINPFKDILLLPLDEIWLESQEQAAGKHLPSSSRPLCTSFGAGVEIDPCGETDEKVVARFMENVITPEVNGVHEARNKYDQETWKLVEEIASIDAADAEYATQKDAYDDDDIEERSHNLLLMQRRKESCLEQLLQMQQTFESADFGCQAISVFTAHRDLKKKRLEDLDARQVAEKAANKNMQEHCEKVKDFTARKKAQTEAKLRAIRELELLQTRMEIDAENYEKERKEINIAVESCALAVRKEEQAFHAFQLQESLCEDAEKKIDEMVSQACNKAAEAREETVARLAATQTQVRKMIASTLEKVIGNKEDCGYAEDELAVEYEDAAAEIKRLKRRHAPDEDIDRQQKIVDSKKTQLLAVEEDNARKATRIRQLKNFQSETPSKRPKRRTLLSYFGCGGDSDSSASSIDEPPSKRRRRANT